MSQVGHTGSTQNAPVDYSSHAAASKGLESLDKVGSGALDSQNIRLADQKAGSGVLVGQQLRIPELQQPDDVKPTTLSSANTEIGDLGKLTEKAAKSTVSLIENAKAGTLTPEQQARLEQHGEHLKGAADYLSSLHGQGLDTAEGQRSVLTGLGFNKTQLDSLLSFANPDDAGNSLASLHGGQAALQGKESALSSLGFSDSQVEALLSLANTDDEGSSLASTHQSGSSPKEALQSLLGFTSGQADRVLALLNGQTPQGSAEQRALLSQIGYSDTEIDVILSAADPQALKQQNAVLKGTTAEQAARLEEQATATQSFAAAKVTEEIIKQLVDIFAVLELLHEMSVQSRRTAKETRSLEYDAAKQEILNQADEMKKAAVHRLIGGVVSGVAKIAAGAISGAGAMAGAKAKTIAGADATAQSQAQSAALQRSMQSATAVSQAVGATGDVTAAGFNYQAAVHDASQKEHEAYQKTHENAAQAESEWMQLQQDMVKTVQSKMDEIIRTTFETQKSLTRG